VGFKVLTVVVTKSFKQKVEFVRFEVLMAGGSDFWPSTRLYSFISKTVLFRKLN
jgi:hypothetical protein